MWLLRQPIEGDKFITVNDVSDAIGECWIDSFGDYVPNTIAIRIDGVEYVLPKVHDLQLGFLTIKIPDSTSIKASTSVQVYSKCSSNPEYITLVQYARPIMFNVTLGYPTSCSNTINVGASLAEHVRLFIPSQLGEYFDFNLNNYTLPGHTSNGQNIFVHQPGNSGSIEVTPSTNGFGKFRRLVNDTQNAYLFSVRPFNGTSIASVRITTDRYFTLRAGYIEIIFKGQHAYYINYLSDNFEENYVAPYKVGDIFYINFDPFKYKIGKNGTDIFTISKRITYSVDGGTIDPAVATPATLSVWTLPKTPGTYTITTSIGQTLKFVNQIRVHSCGEAIDDYYVGVVNQPVTGNVSLNDIPCVGEVNIVKKTDYGMENLSSVILNPDGTFTAYPIQDYVGQARFIYDRYCDGDIIDAAQVIITFNEDCETTDPIWVDTGRVECRDCIAQKEQRNSNTECSGVYPNRWIPIADNTVCSDYADWIDTNETMCEFSHLFKRQINLNRCSDDDAERWIDLGVDPECDCIGEIFVSTCCGNAPYYPVVKLLEAPTEENRALDQCLRPDLGETCIKEKSLRFYTRNDNKAHTYIISLFDCNYKLINQIILEDFNCTNESTSTGNNSFDYTFDFNLQ